MAWIGAAIGAVGALAGGALSSSASRSNTDAINASNANLNQENRDWQTQMSNTAEQRHVTDLEAAGLNPALAYSTAAPVPSSIPSIPAQQNPGAGAMGAGVASAAQAAGMYFDLNKKRADTANVNADTLQKLAVLPFAGATAEQQYRKVNSDISNIEAEFDRLTAETGRIQDSNTRASQAFGLEQQLRQLDVQRGQLGMPALRNQAEWQKNHPDLGGWFGGGKSALDFGLHSAGQAAAIGAMF